MFLRLPARYQQTHAGRLAYPPPSCAPQAEQLANLPSFYAQATPASQNETWMRLNNDPLFAVSAPRDALRLPACRAVGLWPDCIRAGIYRLEAVVGLCITVRQRCMTPPADALPLSVPAPRSRSQIKRQQQEQLAKLRDNPIKMMELLKNLNKARAASEGDVPSLPGVLWRAWR